METLRFGEIRLAVIEDSDVLEIQTLMLRCWDHSMDFADATLVYLTRDDLITVFTVDHADFSAYRIGGHKRFRVLPATQP